MRDRIVCDSCCDFTATEKLSTGFYKVPAKVNVSGVTLTDDKNFRQEPLWAALEISSLELQLFYPDESDYMKTFDCGAQEIYVVTASTVMGEHYEIASRARRQFLQEHPEVLIHVFNTRTFGAGQLLAARRISQMLRSGCAFRQIVRSVERYILEIQTFFLTDDAAHVRELGLIGPPRLFQAEHMALHMDLQGRVRTVGSAMTQKAAERKLLAQLEKRTDRADKTCLIAHSGCPERARRIAQALRKEGLFQNILFLEVGAVNVLLLGRGGILLAY